MEVTHYPKYTLYALLMLSSWFLTFVLHFRSFHLYFGGGALALLPFSLNSSFSAHAIAGDPRPSSSCDGRYVYMLDLPSRFDVLQDCVDGSPLLENRYSRCYHMTNAGIGPELNSSDDDVGIVPATGWYNTNQYALEVIFHNRMRRYDCLTDDPAAATAVYVPFYPAMEIQPHMCGFNSSVRNGQPLEFLRWLSSQPTWAALGGRDHFMVASKTSWVFRAVGGDDLRCGNSFLEQPESRSMTVLTYETNIWVDARWDFAVPYPSYFHPSSAGEVAAWQARVRAAPRPWLFAFAGARRPNGTLLIRDRIFDACYAPPPRGQRCGLLDCRRGCGSPQKLVSLFTSASFCLQPPGDSFMRRSSVDAVIAGCIPVFFREASTFAKQYIWHDQHPNRGGGDRRPYYVLIDHDEVVAGKVDIEQTLSRYTDDEVAAMRDEVVKMIPRFVYKDPRVRFEGDMKDGFDIAIDTLMERMRRIKNGEDMGWKGDDAVEANNGS